MTRHSHQDAVDEGTFARMMDAAADLRPPLDVEAQFVLTAAGRLGMRAAEISHLSESWVDWERQMINIPPYQDCTQGQDGGPCGYCKSQARQSVRKTGVDYETAIAKFWSPKTEASARAIPFDFDETIRQQIEAFFFDYDGWPKSRSSINRRVDDVAEAAGIPTDSIYPHALRATAATWHSYRGLPAPALQSLMGWSKLAVAAKYIRLSGTATRKSLNEVHDRSNGAIQA